MQPAARTPPFGIAAAAALLVGIALAFAAPRLLPWPIAVVLLASGAVVWIRGSRWRLAGPLLLGIGLASVHAHYALALQLPPSLERADVELRGDIVELPLRDIRRTTFLLRVDDDGTILRPLRGRLVRLGWFDEGHRLRPRLLAGQRWQLRARLRAPRGLRNPGGFDSEMYALAGRLAATGYVREPGSARLLAPARGIGAWREAMSARIGSTAGESSRFVQALALGDTRQLDDTDWTVLRANGLTHLIAISGFHVGLVAGFFALLVRACWWLWPSLGRRWPAGIAAAVGAMSGAVLYTTVAGFALPTVRTALMVAVVAIARLLRRSSRVRDGLALAAFAILLPDPLSVLGAGFWLSFLGVAWLMWCLPHAGQGRGWRGLIADFLSAQGVATIGLLPVAAVLFGQASMAGPFANLLAVPWWSLLVVPLSLLGLGLETLHAGWGEGAWWLAGHVFEPSWGLFERLAASPLAIWWLPESGLLALTMALVGAFWLLLPRGTPGKALALLLWLPLLWPDRRLPEPGEAEIEVIDVGQGLSVVVRTANHSLLYDMGPAVRDGFDAGERAVVPALHALGVRRIDLAIASHGDNDHAGGLDAVRAVFALPPVLAPDGAPVTGTAPCVAGHSWDWDGVRFRLLHPTPWFPYLGNEASCVLRVETRHGAVLLPGDISAIIERELVRRDPHSLRADVVLVAHHGSGGSSDPSFVAATGARYALVSSGFGNRFRHPRAEVVERWRGAGARVLDTQDSGSLRVRLTAGGISVETRRGAQPRLWDAARRLAHERAGLSYRPD